MTLCASLAPAQEARQGSLVPTPEEIRRIADIHERSLVEGQAWARVKSHLDVLYRQLLQRGETRQEAIHNLRRISLPGIDVEEFGQKGQEIRRELDLVAQYGRQKSGLSEPASVAAVALTFHDMLQTLVAPERPGRIHMAVKGEDGTAATRRSEDLYEGTSPRRSAKFTEQLGGGTNQECTVETLRLTNEVYFTLTCQARGKDAYPRAVVESQCSINDDRMRASRLTLRTSEPAASREVFVWCSTGPE